MRTETGNLRVRFYINLTKAVPMAQDIAPNFPSDDKRQVLTNKIACLVFLHNIRWTGVSENTEGNCGGSLESVLVLSGPFQ